MAGKRQTDVPNGSPSDNGAPPTGRTRRARPVADGDTGPLERLLEILAAPYDHARDVPEYRSPDPTGGAGYKTFCGT